MEDKAGVEMQAAVSEAKAWIEVSDWFTMNVVLKEAVLTLPFSANYTGCYWENS